MTYAQNTQGTTMDGVLAAVTDLIDEMRKTGASGSSFKRLADPIMVPSGPEASKISIDKAWLRENGITSFAITNPNPFWVRLRGSNDPFIPVTKSTGWLFPPGVHAIYATQYPDWVSALAVNEAGFPIFDGDGVFMYEGARIELAYGTGA